MVKGCIVCGSNFRNEYFDWAVGLRVCYEHNSNQISAESSNLVFCIDATWNFFIKIGYSVYRGKQKNANALECMNGIFWWIILVYLGWINYEEVNIHFWYGQKHVNNRIGYECYL